MLYRKCNGSGVGMCVKLGSLPSLSPHLMPAPGDRSQTQFLLSGHTSVHSAILQTSLDLSPSSSSSSSSPCNIIWLRGKPGCPGSHLAGQSWQFATFPSRCSNNPNHNNLWWFNSLKDHKECGEMRLYSVASAYFTYANMFEPNN